MAEHPAIERVRAHAQAHGVELDIRRFPEGTRTAEDAARAIGCGVAQIVKSLVFIASGQLVLVLVSGADRVDEARLTAHLGVQSLRRATANEARERTGFVIGGISPLGHELPLRVILDRALLTHDVVWAAAGVPDAVFPVRPDDLTRLAGAETADVRVTGASD